MLGFVATKLVNTTLQEQEQTIRNWMNYSANLEQKIDEMQSSINELSAIAKQYTEAGKTTKRTYVKSGKYAKKKVAKKSK